MAREKVARYANKRNVRVNVEKMIYVSLP